MDYSRVRKYFFVWMTVAHSTVHSKGHNIEYFQISFYYFAVQSK